MDNGYEVPVDSFGVYQMDVAAFEWRQGNPEGDSTEDRIREGG